jgi:sugar lactone lactonase YvrE
VNFRILCSLCAIALLGVASEANAAAGMAFDPVGNLYLLGANPSTIFKFSPDGAVKKFAVSTGPGDDWNGIAIDGQGNVFVTTDSTDHAGNVITRILKFTPAGKKSVYVANVAAGQPKTLAIDRAGNIFAGLISVAKPRGSDAIYKIAPGGKRKNIFTKEIEDPTFFALDNAGNLYVYQESGKISKLGPDGKEISSMPADAVYDLTFDQSGNLFLALPHTHEIKKIAPDGSQTSIAADYPWFLAIDKAGNIFVLDNGIQKFSPDGKQTTFAPNPINQ